MARLRLPVRLAGGDTPDSRIRGCFCSASACCFCTRYAYGYPASHSFWPAIRALHLCVSKYGCCYLPVPYRAPRHCGCQSGYWRCCCLSRAQAIPCAHLLLHDCENHYCDRMMQSDCHHWNGLHSAAGYWNHCLSDCALRSNCDCCHQSVCGWTAHSCCCCYLNGCALHLSCGCHCWHVSG